MRRADPRWSEQVRAAHDSLAASTALLDLSNAIRSSSAMGSSTTCDHPLWFSSTGTATGPRGPPNSPSSTTCPGITTVCPRARNSSRSTTACAVASLVVAELKWMKNGLTAARKSGGHPEINKKASDTSPWLINVNIFVRVSMISSGRSASARPSRAAPIESTRRCFATPRTRTRLHRLADC